MRLAVLIPVKRFAAAKGRLTGVLADDDRATLARWMATRVVDVVAEVPTYVACDDDAVAAWARERGAQVIWGAGLGLNGAVDDGVDRITAAGFDHVLVTHADLARPAGLLDVVRAGCITLVPDRRHDGTNVMSFPTRTPLRARPTAADRSPATSRRHWPSTRWNSKSVPTPTCPSISTPLGISPTP